MGTGVQNDELLPKKKRKHPTSALPLKYGHNKRSPQGEVSKKENPNQVIQMISVELGGFKVLIMYRAWPISLLSR